MWTILSLFAIGAAVAWLVLVLTLHCLSAPRTREHPETLERGLLDHERATTSDDPPRTLEPEHAPILAD